MKKLVFATALTLGSLATISATTTPIFHDGIMETVMAQDFTEISVSDVPATVSAALENDHPGASITKAFKNEESVYRIEVAKADGSAVVLHADANGNWLDM